MEDFATNLRALTVQFPPFMMAVVFHEYAHGFVANMWGDTTAKDSGRLTLNPIPHIDLMGTIVLPIMVMATGMNVLFGWAKPVPISPTRFRKYRPGLFWVSIAGPGMNFILAVVSALVMAALVRFAPQDAFFFEPLVMMSGISVYLNFALGLFNLIPLPPLDGSKIIQAFLSYEATKAYEKVAAWSFFIILGLIMTGAMRVLLYPMQVLGALTFSFAEIAFGLPPGILR